MKRERKETSDQIFAAVVAFRHRTNHVYNPTIELMNSIIHTSRRLISSFVCRRPSENASIFVSQLVDRFSGLTTVHEDGHEVDADPQDVLFPIAEDE